MKKDYGIIYKVTNIINGKCYIGQTTKGLKHRKQHHKHYALKVCGKDYFHSAIRKYGWNNFEWEILCECEEVMLDMMETFKIIINYTHWTENGYNLNWGGNSNRGFKHSEETKLLWRISRKGIKISEETKKKMSISHKNPSTETRKKMSLAQKGKVMSIEARKKMSLAQKGKVISDETKKKISDSQIGKKLSNEHKEKLRKYSNNVIQQLMIMKKDGLTIDIISSTTKIPVSTVYYLIKKGCQIV